MKITRSSSNFELTLSLDKLTSHERGLDIYGDFLFITASFLEDSFKSSPELDAEVKSVMLSIISQNRKLQNEENLTRNIQKITMRADIDAFSDSQLPLEVCNSVISSSFNGMKKGEYIYMLQSSSDDVLSSCTDIEFLFVNEEVEIVIGSLQLQPSKSDSMRDDNPTASVTRKRNFVTIGTSCSLLALCMGVFFIYFVKRTSKARHLSSSPPVTCGSGYRCPVSPTSLSDRKIKQLEKGVDRTLMKYQQNNKELSTIKN